MNKFLNIVAGFSIAIALASCTTVGPQQMSYLGEATTKVSVVGKSTHFDFAGIGVSAEQYAEEYNGAIQNAFEQAPAGTTKILNLKSFKAPKTWPLFGGIGMMAAGSGAILLKPTDSSYLSIGSVLYVGGLAMTLINSYDFVVIGEPSESEQP